jgi:hypothetical protein
MAQSKSIGSRQDDRFWDYVDKTSREVASWPDWMKGGIQTQSCAPSEVSKLRSTEVKEDPGSKKS